MKARKFSHVNGLSGLVLMVALTGALFSCSGGDTYDKVVHTRIGLAGMSVLSLAIDPTTPSTVYAGTGGGGVYKSSDGGAHWTQAAIGLGADLYVTALIVDPTVTTTLYAGTRSGTGTGGVFRSIDGAANWVDASSGLTERDIAALAIDPATPATLYAGTSGGGVFKTSTSGGTWALSSTGLAESYVTAVAVNPFSTSELYAGMSSTGVYKSANGGGSWAAANNGLDLMIRSICVDPGNGTIVYSGATGSGGYGKVFKSTDSGSTWTGTWPSGASVLAVAVDPHNSSRIIAGTDPAGACVSVDGGATWAHDSDLGAPTVYSLAIDPVSSTVYAGSSDGVVKVSVVKSSL